MRKTKSPKPELQAQELAEVGEQRRRALVEEAGAHRRRALDPHAGGGLQQHRQLGVVPARVAGEGEAGALVEHAAARQPQVADHRHDVAAVALEERHPLLPGRRVQHLRPRLHVQLARHLVHPFRVERVRLLHQLLVEHAEERRVVARRILEDEDRAHVGGGDVVVDVLAVLDRLDDGEQDLGVAAPQEGGVERLAVERRRAGRSAGLAERRAVEGEQHHRPSGPQGLDLPPQPLRRHVGQRRGGEHEVEPPLPQQRHRLFAAARVGEARRPRLRDVHVLEEHLLGEQPVLLEREGVVGGGDEQHLPHAVRHQAVEAAGADYGAGHQGLACTVEVPVRS